jgi:hypothetical protein
MTEADAKVVADCFARHAVAVAPMAPVRVVRYRQMPSPDAAPIAPPSDRCRSRNAPLHTPLAVIATSCCAAREAQKALISLRYGRMPLCHTCEDIGSGARLCVEKSGRMQWEIGVPG